MIVPAATSDATPPGVSITIASHPGGPRWTPATDGALYITGKCGSGKTELLRHIAAAAHSTGCEVTVLEPTSRGGRRSRWPRGTRIVRGAAAGPVLTEALETDTATDQVLMIDGAIEIEHQMRHGIGGHPTTDPQDLITRAYTTNPTGVHIAMTSLDPTPPRLWTTRPVSLVALGRCPSPAGWYSLLGWDIPDTEPQPGQGWLIRHDHEPAWLDLAPCPTPLRTVNHR